MVEFATTNPLEKANNMAGNNSAHTERYPTKASTVMDPVARIDKDEPIRTIRGMPHSGVSLRLTPLPVRKPTGSAVTKNPKAAAE